MPAQLNHTIVWCRDQQVSAPFLADLLGLAPPTRFGPFLVVEAGNSVSLDFHDHTGEIPSQHYAFLVSDEEFDEIFGRIQSNSLPFWADPGLNRANVLNTNDGGRGCYFHDPDGHLLEILTRPYGSGA
jgi:catechol 2,3-dioxygenase-like lactoylglutathione lyase family enzyme